MDGLDRLETLAAIMDRLREPGGCPWDREQDYDSLRKYLLEECYEVAEALDRRDPQGLREELGDLLFQIVFLSRLAKEDGEFTLDDVIRGIAEKMIRRHPHVFGSETAETAHEVVKNWEEIKRREKAPDGKRSLLDGIPCSLPAIFKAQRLGTQAATVGFDWKDPAEILDKVEEELRELRQAVVGRERREVREELGDILFSLVMLARRMEIDAEGALARTNQKFRRRFEWIEEELARRGIEIEGAGLELMESLWERAKREDSA